MSLSADQYRGLIVSELKGGTDLLQAVGTLWAFNDRFKLTPEVQYLRTKVAAIDWLLGNLDESVTPPPEGDQTARVSNRRTILLALRALTVSTLTQSGYGAGGPAMGLLATTAPVPSTQYPILPNPWPDANDTIYTTGDPNRRPFPVIPG